MYRLHLMTGVLLLLKYAAGFTMPLWLALLPSYIYPSAIIVVFVLAFLTGRIVVAGRKATEKKGP